MAEAFDSGKFTGNLIEAFAGTFLSPLYDNAKPTPEFHRRGWEMYASDSEQCAIAAPRGHAKSTAFTHDYVLAEVLFRRSEYVVIVSSNEEMAIEHLGDISRELSENESLIKAFSIDKLLVEAKTDIIVRCKDGHQFRIIARGSGQKMRGRKWNGKRPGLIVADDLEDDEQVENKDRRDKFRHWFQRALQPCLRNGGRLRIHGTILHEDSLLARIMKDKTWETQFHRAHASFDDFSDILWPEMFTETKLRSIRQRLVSQFDGAGYSQEYLNDPFDNSEAYLKRGDFLPMDADDLEKEKRICIGVDFAISKKDKANRTSFTVGGQCQDNILHFIGQYVDRWDSLEIIDMMFNVQQRHAPEVFFVEEGVIWKSIEPMLRQQMIVRGSFLNCIPIVSSKDKATRGRSWQRRMRAGACRFDKESDWYPTYEAECLRFTGVSDAVLDDQFDSSSILSIGIDSLSLVEAEDFMDEEEQYQANTGPREGAGRSTTTGY